MPINALVVPSSNATFDAISYEYENELRRIKRHRIETSFGSDFITTFLIENFDIVVISDELVFISLIEEDPNTYDKVVRSKDVIF